MEKALVDKLVAKFLEDSCSVARRGHGGRSVAKGRGGRRWSGWVVKRKMLVEENEGLVHKRRGRAGSHGWQVRVRIGPGDPCAHAIIRSDHVLVILPLALR